MPKKDTYRCFAGIPESKRETILPLVTTVFEQNKELFDYCREAKIGLDIALDIILEYRLNKQRGNPKALKRYLDNRVQEIYESMGSKPGDGSTQTVDDFEMLENLYESEYFTDLYKVFFQYLSVGEILALANVAFHSKYDYEAAFVRGAMTIEMRAGVIIDITASYKLQKIIIKE